MNYIACGTCGKVSRTYHFVEYAYTAKSNNRIHKYAYTSQANKRIHKYAYTAQVNTSVQEYINMLIGRLEYDTDVY